MIRGQIVTLLCCLVQIRQTRFNGIKWHPNKSLIQGATWPGMITAYIESLLSVWSPSHVGEAWVLMFELHRLVWLQNVHAATSFGSQPYLTIRDKSCPNTEGMKLLTDNIKLVLIPSPSVWSLSPRSRCIPSAPHNKIPPISVISRFCSRIRPLGFLLQ